MVLKSWIVRFNFYITSNLYSKFHTLYSFSYLFLMSRNSIHIVYITSNFQKINSSHPQIITLCIGNNNYQTYDTICSTKHVTHGWYSKREQSHVKKGLTQGHHVVFCFWPSVSRIHVQTPNSTFLCMHKGQLIGLCIYSFLLQQVNKIHVQNPSHNFLAYVERGKDSNAPLPSRFITFIS